MKKLITLTYLLLGVIYCLSAQNALNFDGTDDVVQTNYSGVLGSDDRTFEAWVFVSSNAPASNLAILDYGTNAVGSRNTFAVTGSRGLIFISGGTNANLGTGANTVPVNQWTHVAFVLDNGTGYLYVNGVQAATGNLTTVNTPANNQNVYIGQRVPGGTIPFNGSIDEVRIWDTARTAAEIQANMNTELCGSQNSLDLYLKLNEGIAGGINTGLTSATDFSGNGNNGTLNNFTLNGSSSNWVTGATLSTPGGTNTFATISTSSCGSYTLPSGNTVTTSGTYMDT
ncbi:MAG: LamG domain-containing protein, partial [Saprospiraceae bacterium]